VTVEPTLEVGSPPATWFRERVDDELHRFLSRERDRAAGLSPDATMLLDELALTIRAGGKRLRPLFCYWGYRAGGGRDEFAVARAGAALELLHTFAVIHDDVMDRAQLRRGQPTAHRRLAERWEVEPEERERFGRSAAILAGDLAQALADQLLLESGCPADRIPPVLRRFNDMRTQAVTGEFLDVLSAVRREQDEQGARRVAALKSASYTVVGPVLLGAALAGAGPGLESGLAAYAWPLGEAFQLRDDVLGTFGDPAVTGKDRDTDIREGKQTALVVKAGELAGPEGRRMLTERLGRPDLDAGQVEEVRDLLRASGALAETIALIGMLAAQAKAALDGLPVSDEVRSALASLADLVAVRDA
jgi:geranylgeranyl diphosphate synthase, type I